VNNVHQHPSAVAADVSFVIRPATADDAAAIHALVEAHRQEGHLLPRQLDEIQARAARFVVADVDGAIKACAELVPLSKHRAEVRSLVVSGDVRRHGVAARLLNELQQRAAAEGFRSLLALAHDPRFFIRHNFSIVPHEWLAEKIARDCHQCALFRCCGQYAMLLSLTPSGHGQAPLGGSRPATAVAVA
jgi:amino-acid N-acetyltransferase